MLIMKHEQNPIKQVTCFLLPKSFSFCTSKIEENAKNIPFRHLVNPTHITENMGFVPFLSIDDFVLSSKSVDSVFVRFEEKHLPKAVIDNAFDGEIARRLEYANLFLLSKKKQKQIYKDLKDELLKNALCKSSDITISFSRHGKSYPLLIVDTANKKQIELIIGKWLSFNTHILPPIRSICTHKSVNSLMLELFANKYDERFEVTDSCRYASLDTGEIVTAKKTDLSNQNLQQLCSNGFITEIGLKHIKTGIHFVLSSDFTLKQLEIPELKNDDEEKRIYAANRQEFQMRLISQIYDDLFASCDGLHGDLFDDEPKPTIKTLQETLAADENIQGASVTVGGEEVTIYKKAKQ